MDCLLQGTLTLQNWHHHLGKSFIKIMIKQQSQSVDEVSKIYNLLKGQKQTLQPSRAMQITSAFSINFWEKPFKKRMSFQDFKGKYEESVKNLSDDKLLDLFQSLDFDKDGVLNVQEIQRILGVFGIEMNVARITSKELTRHAEIFRVFQATDNQRGVHRLFLQEYVNFDQMKDQVKLNLSQFDFLNKIILQLRQVIVQKDQKISELLDQNLQQKNLHHQKVRELQQIRMKELLNYQNSLKSFKHKLLDLQIEQTKVANASVQTQTQSWNLMQNSRAFSNRECVDGKERSSAKLVNLLKDCKRMLDND